ncbi:MAG: hypothetical protein O2971_14445 [Proteobacteria bacterium]|nr:hypothetical protein [Pseudomonadota bacterium]
MSASEMTLSLIMGRMQTLIVLLAFCLAIQAEVFAAAKSSNITVTSDGEFLLVVNPDSDSVSIVGLGVIPALVSEIPVGRMPQSIAVDLFFPFAYVVNRMDDSVTVLDLRNNTAMGCVAVQDEPFAVVVGSNYLFVSNQGSDSISVIHRASLLPLMSISTAAAPKGLALSDDGSRLFVTHFFSGSVSVIDTERMQVIAVVSTSSLANVSQSISIDTSRDLAYLPQTFSNSTNKALLFDTTVAPVVSVVDLHQLVNLRTHRISLDVIDEPVGLPIDLLRTPADLLYVVNAASNDVTVIDLKTNIATAHLRVGANPRGIALSPDGARAFVNNTLSGSVSIIDTIAQKVTQELIVTDIPLSPGILNGKRLFNDSSSPAIAREQWIACASCHFDGAHDGRTWFFKDGLRNTPSLLGVAETLPMHWSGDLDELHDVESTVRNIQAGTGLIPGADNCTPACDAAPPNSGRSADLDDLARYMETLRFSSNPSLENFGAPDPRVQAGSLLFHSAQTGCVVCHTPPLFTDRRRHDVGTGGGPLEAKGSAFDTPSLRSIARTPPYLHDGSALTLRDVLVNRNPSDLHGVTSQLSNADLGNMEAFLAALPYQGVVMSEPPACQRQPVAVQPGEVLAAIEMTLAEQTYRAGDRFILELHTVGIGTADLYGAVIFPDDSFISLNESFALSQLNQITRMRHSLLLEHGSKLELLNLVLPGNLAKGNYRAIGIAVAEGTDVLDTANWLAVDEIGFMIE